MKTVDVDFLKQALTQPNLIKQDKAWFSHIKPYLTAYKPKMGKDGMYSLDDYFNSLGQIPKNEMVGKIKTEEVHLIWKILGKFNRSELLASSMSQITHPEYSAAVPIGMQAMREVYGIKYGSWNLSNNPLFTAMMVGKSLAKLPEVRQYLHELTNANFEPLEPGQRFTEDMFEDNHIPDPSSIEQQKKWREIITKDGMVSTTDYTKLGKVYQNNHPLGYNYISKFYWCMLTQTWIFDPKIRHPDMITNIESWDKLAPSLENISIEDSDWPPKPKHSDLPF